MKLGGFQGGVLLARILRLKGQMRSITKTIIMCIFMTCATAVADIRPSWSRSDFSQRAVFSFPKTAKSFSLLKIPHEKELADESTLAVLDKKGKPLRYRVIHSGKNETSVLVSSTTSTTQKDCVAYYNRLDPKADTNSHANISMKPPPPETQSLYDPKPVRTTLHRIRGRGLPSTWDEMLYLYSRSTGTIKELNCKNFISELVNTSSGRSSRRYGRGVGQYITRMTSWAHIPEDGDYRFSINSPTIAFLFVDGLAAATSTGTAYDEWQTGEPVKLEAGVRLIEAWTVTDKLPGIEIGWQTPGSDAPPVAIPEAALITSAEVEKIRYHAVDKALHPSFTYKLGSAYSFRGVDATFVNVSFTARAESWLGSSRDYRWGFDRTDSTSLFAPGTPTSSYVTDKNPRHVFTGQGRHTAVLYVRDSLGFVSRKEQVIDCRLKEPKESIFSAKIVSLPATCYGRDIVEPLFNLVGGYVNTKKPFILSWTIVDKNGDTQTFSENIGSSKDAARIALAKMRADAISSISWSVDHVGHVLTSGTVRFLSPPFSELPISARGDRLYAKNGDQLVLIPYECADRYNQPPLDLSKTSASVVCIDDTLSNGDTSEDNKHLRFDGMLSGRLHSDISYVSCHSWSSHPGMMGSLIKLLRTPTEIAPGSDIVVLSVGLQDMLNAVEPSTFERQAAALTDIVSTTLKCPVVWVTAPPCPSQAERSRQFATAIMRVADARQIPVADLFSVCHITKENTTRLSSDLDFALTSEGHELTARLIAQTLTSTADANDN
jgi:hypothetical protein